MIKMQVDVDKFASREEADGWPVKQLAKGDTEFYAYYLTIDSINDMSVTLVIPEDSLEDMLGQIRKRWPLESR